MSHVVTVKTQIRDLTAIAAACHRLALAAPVQGSAQLYDGQAVGVVVRLPGWQYPVVCDTATGEVRYDHFGGRWGDPKHLDQFFQIYAVERAKIEARKKGYAVSEQLLQDGSIRVQIVAA